MFKMEDNATERLSEEDKNIVEYLIEELGMEYADVILEIMSPA